MRSFTGFEKGINLGGWLSQWEPNTKEHRETYITKEDIAVIASWGLDHVRLPVDYDIIETEDGEAIEDGYVYISRCIEWCEEYGLKVIIDLHKAFGYSFCPTDKRDKTIFFHDETMQNRYYALWRQIASRYAHKSENVAYELLNEIVSPEVVDDWNKIIIRTVKEIRTVAPDSWIVFGGVMYNSVSAVPALPDFADRKVVYTFHCYEPMMFTHQGAHWVENMPVDLRISYPASLEAYREKAKLVSHDLAGIIFDPRLKNGFGPEFFESLFEDAIKVANERDIPLYCGEYGVIDHATAEDTFRWLSDINAVFTKYKMARSYWTYKVMNFGIADERCAPMIKDIVSKL